MALKTSQVIAKNCIVMGVLAEDNKGGAHPPRSELDAWIAATKSPDTWVLNSQDPQMDAEVIFGTNVRDTWVIIDLKTMKVKQISTDNADQSISDLLALCI